MNDGKNSMVTRVQVYVHWKQDLGYSMKSTGGQLMRFARYADSVGHTGPITISLILRWAQSASGSARLYRARRAEVARTFARFEATFEPQTQVPQRRLLGPAHQRIQPYIYTSHEIANLMAAARKLTPVDGLRPRTYSVLIGLLASTGLRTCEALRLGRTEFDSTSRQLVITETKFHKSRVVPVDLSVARALLEYSCFRDHYWSAPHSERFLLSEQGRALLPSVVHYTFRKLRSETQIKGQHDRRAPRLYDLRHTFACRVLQKWYTEGVDVNQRLPYLSTYLGHIKPTDTYWYLSAVPELMNVAMQRSEETDVIQGGTP